MAPTILGYDDILNGSYLEQRVDRFLSRPADPLTEWQSDLYDYGVVNIFGQYLRNRYGDSVLSDALKSRNTGMKSITAALNKNGFSEDFAQVFTDWTIAMAINNCSAGQAYCLKDGNLKNLRVIPSTYFLPLSGESTVSITVQSKDWAGNWYKFIGGHDTVTLEFKSPEELNVTIPYILDMSDGTFSVSVLKVGSDSTGKLEIPGFGKTVRSLIIIPSVQDKVSDISGSYPSYVLSWTVKISGGEETEPIIVERPRPQTGVSYTAAELQRKIAEIQQTIAALRAQLAAAQGGTVSGVSSCGPFEKNLYYGMKGAEVSCLQDFLKKQGPDIYPEGLVTGNFLGLTKAAVIRFQEKYAYEILAPLSFSHGTGFVGSMTRAKINKL
ncbi:MAG: Peptidase M6 immune inhibitor A [Parcubacteria group bacterium GW2011_GWA2_47_9]|nr:MAG: Peptidase M6 immune inhibitor A [Parcubacteria group bacterium GW2011_GWA2_47_9]